MAALKLVYSAPPRKSHKRLPGNVPVENATHFGLTVRSGTKYGLRIDRGTYARINKHSSIHFPRELAPKLWDASAKYYEDVDHRIHTDQWCTAYQARALENYDLNMAYFAALDRSEFNQAIDAAVVAQKGMVEVTDLNEWEGKTGLYVMVLDDYRQGYVGVTESLGGVKARVRKHWSSSKQFDRLLFGTVIQSILAMDSFRALDTTRIFAAKVRNPHELENKVIESLPGKFLLNRIMGGRGDLLGFVSALGVNILKTHDLEPGPTDTQPTD